LQKPGSSGGPELRGWCVMPAYHDIAIAVAFDQSPCIKIRFGCVWIELVQAIKSHQLNVWHTWAERAIDVRRRCNGSANSAT